MADIKACIFDLDGVLVDTAGFHYRAWKKLANRLNFDFTIQDNEKLKGINRKESLELILDWGKVFKTSYEKQELAQLKNTWYVEMISGMTPVDVLPGALRLLQELKAAGYKIALGSASKNAGIILNKVELIRYFNAVVDGNVVTESKPDPQVFLKGAEMLQVSPASCVVFEDAFAGVEAAKAGGMKVVGIGSTKALAAADLVISGLHEMNIQKLRDL
ncbi:MAG: beta-phosphoglucomutase [Flavobacterium sp.]|nr:beta-phosphoglucomutase [Pedobacter sp.]